MYSLLTCSITYKSPRLVQRTMACTCWPAAESDCIVLPCCQTSFKWCGR